MKTLESLLLAVALVVNPAENHTLAQAVWADYQRASAVQHKMNQAVNNALTLPEYEEIILSDNMIWVYSIPSDELELYQNPEIQKILHRIGLMNTWLSVRAYIFDVKQWIFKFDITSIDEPKYYIIRPPEFREISQSEMQKMLSHE
jgi:hypothetical protein